MNATSQSVSGGRSDSKGRPGRWSLAAGALLAAAFVASAGTASAQTTIRCPGDQMRKEIVTPLPDGWWQTPLVNRLTGTRIARIGGEDTLICEYGPAGTVQRRVPARTPHFSRWRRYDSKCCVSKDGCTPGHF